MRKFGWMLSALVALGVMGVRGEVVSVPAGTTCELNSMVSGTNAVGNVIDLGAGATLKLLPPALGSDGFAFYGMSSGAPCMPATFPRAGAQNAAADAFVWDCFYGSRTNITWGEIYKGSSAGYAVLYAATWHVPETANYGFYLSIDDFGLIEIDGTTVLASTWNCQTMATNNVLLTAGDHALRIVLSNTADMFGAYNGKCPGVAFSATNELLTADTVAANGTRFSDPGGGSAFSPALLQNASSAGTLAAHVCATNGPVTLDASALGTTALRVVGGLVCWDAFTVTGAEEIVFGAGQRQDTISTPRFDVRGLAFADAAAPRLVLMNELTAFRLPTNEAINVSIATNAIVAAYYAEALERFTTDNVLNLDTWDLYVINPQGISDTTEVRVGAGRCIRFKPVEYAGLWDWYGQADNVYTNRVVLTDPTSVYEISSHNAVSFQGSVTGVGQVKAATTWGTPSYSFGGTFDVTGPLDIPARITFILPVTNFVGTVTGHELSAFSCHPEGYGTVATTARVARVVGAGSSASAENYFGLYAGNRHTLFVDRAEGRIRVYGANDASTVRIGTCACTQLALYHSADLVIATNVSTSCELMVPADTSSKADCHLTAENPLSFQTVAIGAGETLDVAGTVAIDNLEGSGTLKLASGAQVTVGFVARGVTVDSSAGTLTVAKASASWKEKVTLWMDPSQTNTLRFLTDNGGNVRSYTNSYPLVDTAYDVRPAQTNVYWYNNRKWTMNYYDLQPQVYPYLVTQGGPNGLAYLSFGTFQAKVKGVGVNGEELTEARRLQLWQKDVEIQGATRNNYATVPAVWAVLVYNTARGGGASVIGTKKGTIKRWYQGVDKPLSSSNVTWYADGVLCNPTATTPTGAWQLMSFAIPADDPVAALTWQTEYSTSGGVDYGEVILFGQMPTAEEREMCERYVAAKWGVAKAVYAGAGAPLTLRGLDAGARVALAADADAVLDGTFGGTVALNGGTLTVAEGRPTLAEAEIPSEGRCGWFDPSAAGALLFDTTFNGARSLAVRVLHGRNNAGIVTTQGTGNFYLLGTYAQDYDRRPWLSEGARGGVATKWLDFSNKYAGDAQGNTIRLFPEPAPAADSANTAASSVKVRTAFVALDSSHGGGMPLLDTVGASGVIKQRPNLQNSWSPIWASGTTALIRDGTNRLDGVVVNGKTAGYNARPEVLSLETTNDVALSYFGFYGMDKPDQYPNSEILGEILLYNRILDATARADVEAYLMRKWCGKVPAGYTDMRAATVTGTGTLKAASRAVLPQLGAGFTGTVALGETSFAFTLDPSQTPAVTDALTVPGPLTLPDACAVTVTCAAKPKPGAYTLISSAGFTGETAWTLTLAGTSGTAKAHLAVANGKLQLEVIGAGSVFIVR